MSGVSKHRSAGFVRLSGLARGGRRGSAGFLGVRRGSALLLVLAAAALLLWSVPALALSQRGHAFAFSFGGEGEGDGQLRLEGALKFKEAAGIAVNEATGDLYVVDRANNRVQQFGPNGEFKAAWGWGVRDGVAEYEVCTSACRAGLKGTHKGELSEAGAIAVDNSPSGAGEVYVGANAAAKHPDIQRFSSTGSEALGKLPIEEEGRLDGLGVDSKGDVWLYRGEEEESGSVEGFTDAKPPVRLESSFPSPLECPKPGFAVDAQGENFYVGHELQNGEESCPALAEVSEARAIVSGKLNAAEVLSKFQVAITALDHQSTSAVAVDQASGEGTPLGGAAKGDVYIDNEASIASFTSEGALIQRFGSEQLKQGMGVAVNPKTGDVYVLDASEDKVLVFEPEPPGKPTMEGLSAQNLTPSSVKLSAQINPVGADTRYYFQYGTADCVTSPSSCTDAPAAPGPDIGEGFTEQGASVTLEGLLPSTTYHYRLIATNANGVAEGADELGTITTLPSPVGLLADSRAWEMVSPPEKDGSGIEPFAKEGALVQASEDGSAITYAANGPVVPNPEGNRGPEPTQVLSARSPAGWSSQDIVTPRSFGEGFEPGQPWEYRFFSSDLSLSLLQPPFLGEPSEHPPLAPGASEKTLYVRDNAPIAPGAPERKVYEEAEANRGFLSPGYLPLVTSLNDTAEVKPSEKTKFGGQLQFAAATPDLSHVVFESGVPLVAGSGSGLYEWESPGKLALVSVLPGGAPAAEAVLGYDGVSVRNALSSDGTRVVWTGEEAEAHRLFMRDTSRMQTIKLDAAHGVAEPVGEENEVAFQGASRDGSKVLFTDTVPLTPESAQRPLRVEENPPDLYECEIVEAAGKLTCNLKDLTPMRSGGSADVLNVVPGISEDGSNVYFVANGVLTPDARPGHCVHLGNETPPPEATCNLYRWHNGAITLIAVLSNQDAGDWGSLVAESISKYVADRPDLADLTARVSPNGEYFAFMSKMPLTGYENVDSNHRAEGIRDQEVYLYDARTSLLVCASCNSGAPSVGVLDTQHSGEGEGLVVDRREDWTGQYLAGSVPGWAPLGKEKALHQPRYLSNDGRLFFNSPAQLVPQATNGKEDVYQYEPKGIGSCVKDEGCVSLISSGTAKQESAFLDASENGNDAFFLTAQPLVAADHDTNFDMYDARVCTSASPCLSSQATTEQPCETSKACNPQSSSQPTFGSPASGALSGAGNLAKQQILGATNLKPKPLTRAQKLAKALKLCRKDKNRRRRVACERRARKQYAPKSKARRPGPAKKVKK